MTSHRLSRCGAPPPLELLVEDAWDNDYPEVAATPRRGPTLLAVVAEIRDLLLLRQPEPPQPEPDTAEEPPTPLLEPAWLSTKQAARVLRVRTAKLYGHIDDGLLHGVAREVGKGGTRRHVRWNEQCLHSWWANAANGGSDG